MLYQKSTFVMLYQKSMFVMLNQKSMLVILNLKSMNNTYQEYTTWYFERNAKYYERALNFACMKNIMREPCI